MQVSSDCEFSLFVRIVHVCFMLCFLFFVCLSLLSVQCSVSFDVFLSSLWFVCVFVFSYYVSVVLCVFLVFCVHYLHFERTPSAERLRTIASIR